MEQFIPFAPWIAVLLLGGAIIWRIDRYMHRRLRARIGNQEVSQIERRTAAIIAERTVDAAAALKNAELAKRTAEARAAAELVDQLQGDHLAAERAIIEARVRAEQKLAIENVRADREAQRQDEDILGKFARYLNTYRSPAMTLSSFIKLMSDQ